MAESIARVLYDGDGNPVTVYESAGDYSLAIQSMEIERLLFDVRTELRILNMHMRAITELPILGSNVEDE